MRLQITAALLFGCSLRSAFGADALIAQAPIKLPGRPAKFDFIAIDGDRRSLLAAHTGNGSLDVINVDRGELVKSIPVGAAQDCAIDQRGRQYLASVSKPPHVAIVDAEKLEVTGTVPLKGPADLLAFNPVSGMAYVCHDDGKEVWVISPAEKKIVGNLALPTEGPEDLTFDESGKHLYQAMKAVGTLAVFDLPANKLAANWSTAPAQSPHGIAAIPELNAIAISGGNGKLVIMSEKDGTILSSADLPLRVDQIAYDREMHRLYCASGLGVIAIYSVNDGKIKPRENVTSTQGARSIAVDPKTHSVWIAYTTEAGSFVQAFQIPK